MVRMTEKTARARVAEFGGYAVQIDADTWTTCQIRGFCVYVPEDGMIRTKKGRAYVAHEMLGVYSDAVAPIYLSDAPEDVLSRLDRVIRDRAVMGPARDATDAACRAKYAARNT